MASVTSRRGIVFDLVLVAGRTSLALRHLPLMWFVAGATARGRVRRNRMFAFGLLFCVARLAGRDWRRFGLVRLMALGTLKLHRGGCRPVNLFLSLRFVAFQAVLALGPQRAVLTQKVVAIQAVAFGHRRSLDGLIAVTRETYLLGWREAVERDRVALETVQILVLDVNLVPGRIRDLLPLAIAAFVASLARFVIDKCVLRNVIRLIDRVLDDLFEARDRAGLMTAMAVDFGVFAGGPSVPRFFHCVARPAEGRIVLSVAIDAEGPKSAERHKPDHHCHYS